MSGPEHVLPSLVAQFQMESILISLMATILALGLAAENFGMDFLNRGDRPAGRINPQEDGFHAVVLGQPVEVFRDVVSVRGAPRRR